MRLVRVCKPLLLVQLLQPVFRAIGALPTMTLAHAKTPVNTAGRTVLRTTHPSSVSVVPLDIGPMQPSPTAWEVLPLIVPDPSS